MKEEYERAWEDFMQHIHTRLDAGAREYGDRSFSRDLNSLLHEIEQEIADVVGWAYVLHVRIGRLRKAVQAVDNPVIKA